MITLIINILLITNKKYLNYNYYQKEKGIFNKHSLVDKHRTVFLFLMFFLVLTLGNLFFYLANIHKHIFLLLSIYTTINFILSLIYYFLLKKNSPKFKKIRTNYYRLKMIEIRWEQHIKSSHKMAKINFDIKNHALINVNTLLNSTFLLYENNLSKCNEKFIICQNTLFDFLTIANSQNKYPNFFKEIETGLDNILNHFDEYELLKQAVKNIEVDIELKIKYLHREISGLDSNMKVLYVLKESGFKNNLESVIHEKLCSNVIRNKYRMYCQSLLDLEDMFENETNLIIRSINKVVIKEIISNLNACLYDRCVLCTEFFSSFHIFNCYNDLLKIEDSILDEINKYTYSLDKISETTNDLIGKINIINANYERFINEVITNKYIFEITNIYLKQVDDYNKNIDLFISMYKNLKNTLIKKLNENESFDLDLAINELERALAKRTHYEQIQIEIAAQKSLISLALKNYPLGKAKIAIINDDVSELSKIVESTDVLTKSDDAGNTIFHYIAENNAVNCFNFLKEQGNLLTRNKYGEFPLDLSSGTLYKEILNLTTTVQTLNFEFTYFDFLSLSRDALLLKIRRLIEVIPSLKEINSKQLLKLKKLFIRINNPKFNLKNGVELDFLHNLSIEIKKSIFNKYNIILTKIMQINSYSKYYSSILEIPKITSILRMFLFDKINKLEFSDISDLQIFVNKLYILSDSSTIIKSGIFKFDFRKLNISTNKSLCETTQFHIYTASLMKKNSFYYKELRIIINNFIDSELTVLKQIYQLEPKIDLYEFIASYDSNFKLNNNRFDCYYRLLEIDSTASKEACLLAYKRAIIKNKNQTDNTKIELLNKAYKYLIMG